MHPAYHTPLSCHVIALSVWTRNFLQTSACYSVFTLFTDTKPSFIANQRVYDFPKTHVLRLYRFTEFRLSLGSSYSHQPLLSYTNTNACYLCVMMTKHRRNFANNFWGVGYRGNGLCIYSASRKTQIHFLCLHHPDNCLEHFYIFICPFSTQ